MPDRPLTDEELIRRHRQGSAAALAELWVRYDGLVYGLAHGVMRSRHGADDARQEAFLRVRGSLEQLDDPSRFAPWLATITRNVCVSLLRREKPARPLDSLTEDEHPRVTIDAAVEQRERRTLLRQLVDRLPEEQRTVVELHYFQEERVPAIARFLGLPESTVKWRIHEGRVALREAATAEGYADPER